MATSPSSVTATLILSPVHTRLRRKMRLRAGGVFKNEHDGPNGAYVFTCTAFLFMLLKFQRSSIFPAVFRPGSDQMDWLNLASKLHRIETKPVWDYNCCGVVFTSDPHSRAFTGLLKRGHCACVCRKAASDTASRNQTAYLKRGHSHFSF